MAATFGTLTALVFLLLSWCFGFAGPPVLGIAGYIGSFPASALLRSLPDTVTGETRTLVCLLVQSPLWACVWYFVLRSRPKRNDNHSA